MNYKNRFLILISVIFLIKYFFFNSAYSETFQVNNNISIIGSLQYHSVKKGESLIELARQYSLGYNEIVDANPQIDPFVPPEGVEVIIPKFWILPDKPEKFQGIVINLSEMRLYYFHNNKKNNLLTTFPIGIGDDGIETPLGKFKISQKVINPSWYVPESIKKERPELPPVVPPGPENPLGTHALRLSGTSYLIHGTNRPYAIGRKVTHGCIRLYPEEIPKLYDIVPIGTEVLIVRQPVKAGRIGDEVYVEVHIDDQLKDFDYLGNAMELLSKKGLLRYIDTFKLYHAIKQKSGIPTPISTKSEKPQVIFSDLWL